MPGGAEQGAGIETVAETFLIPPLPRQVPEQVDLGRRWQNTWLCLCEGQAGSGLSSPAVVHARLVEGKVPLTSVLWKLTVCYIDTVTLFWALMGDYRELPELKPKSGVRSMRPILPLLLMCLPSNH